MTTYIAISLPSLNDGSSVAFLSDVSNNFNYCRRLKYGYVTPASPEHVKERPAKRSKVDPTMAGNVARSGLPKRGRASCLSELPTMPLDILFEIFSHLHPSDLLSLSRVNKEFRSQLLSSGFLSLWNVCFRLCGAPTTPVDMSSASWAHLLFGGAYCYSCGAKPVTKILFSFRRRACRSCITTHLRCLSEVSQEYKDMIRSEPRSVGKPCCTRHWWDEDVMAFEAELNALKNPVGDPAGAGATISAFLAKKKEGVTAITEHARICATWEKDRNTDRSTKLSDVRVKRFEDIKARLLALGYIEKDVDQLRLHREVRTSKPMSDRVWKRVEPLLLPEVNEARDRRLVQEGGDDYKLLRQRVVVEYSTFLKTLTPILLALSPSATRFLCENQALASALAQNNGPNDMSVRSRFLETINSLRPELETRNQERAKHLRSLLPEMDGFEVLTDDEAIALATSIYKCSDCRLFASGPHMLAHDCDRAQKPGTFRPQLGERGRETVKVLLQLLGLGSGTTALDLDRRNDKFVCMQCSRGSFIQGGKEVLGRCVRDWRSCIVHAISSKHERWHKCSPKWRVVTPTETAGLIWGESSIAQAYGCLHCPLRIDPNRGTVQWYAKLGEVREHVQKVHERNNPLEGCDFFHDFGTRRVGRNALLPMDQ
ncbi:hypothetical protein V8E52_009451 [Russula decolorans]